MNIFGMGPLILGPSLLLGVLIFVLSILFPSVAMFTAINPLLTLAIGALLAFVGFVKLFVTGKQFIAAHRSGKLITTGPYSKCLHPIYSIWMLWIMPAFAIAFRMPFLFLVPLVAFILFTLLIGKEEKATESKFGKDYIKYRQATPRVQWWVL